MGGWPWCLDNWLVGCFVGIVLVGVVGVDDAIDHSCSLFVQEIVVGKEEFEKCLRLFGTCGPWNERLILELACWVIASKGHTL